MVLRHMASTFAPMKNKEIKSRTTGQLLRGVFRLNPLVDENTIKNYTSEFMNRVKIASGFVLFNQQKMSREASSH
jgi:hypothetical protein